MVTNTQGGDGYVRIPTSALGSLELRHLISEKDLTIAVIDSAQAGTAAAITGYTEWIGTWQHLTVSLGWDWGVVHGVVVVLNPNEIRTNIQLIGEDSRVEPPALAKIHLLDWIESLPWRENAIEDLLREDDSS
jgi:Domain of unknown function (DUF4902)